MGTQSSRPLQAVLSAGLAAGAMDIAAACGFYALRGVKPIRILQSVASGLLGAAAFQGGVPTAALGLALHFSIATVAAAIYYLASRRLPFLVRRPLVAGPAFGVAVYLFMNHLVVPLSAAAQRPFVLSTALSMVAIHMVCVGLPIAWIVRRHAPAGVRQPS